MQIIVGTLEISLESGAVIINPFRLDNYLGHVFLSIFTYPALRSINLFPNENTPLMS